MRTPALLTALTLSSCAAIPPPPSASSCLYPLQAFAGYGRHGRPLYRVYGWSRANRQFPTLEAALPDHPEVAARVRHGEQESAVGVWMWAGGVFNVLQGATMAALSSSDGHQVGSEPTFAIGLANVGLGTVVAAVGVGLNIAGERRSPRALDDFNRQAEATGCTSAPPP